VWVVIDGGVSSSVIDRVCALWCFLMMLNLICVLFLIVVVLFGSEELGRKMLLFLLELMNLNFLVVLNYLILLVGIVNFLYVVRI